MNRKTLVITDNTYAKSLAEELNTLFGDVDIAQSQTGQLKEVSRIDVSQVARSVIEKYDLVISIHCKQMFPKHLIESVRCINVHPGFNPYNRGWYPQVFSIIDGSASGVTIHEIDELIDHGKIIVQKKIELTEWDTSGSAYKKIMKAVGWEEMPTHFLTSASSKEGKKEVLDFIDQTNKEIAEHF